MAIPTVKQVTEMPAATLVAPVPETPQPLAGRLMSLDVFRGITIAAMILVNDPGGGDAAYWPLHHARWNGWTPTDLVFPFFLFIVGVAMVFSFASRLKHGDSRARIMLHVVKRSAILFAIGIFIINSFPDRYDLRHIRIEGVLQRIAVCYLVCSVLVLWTGTRARVAVIAVCLAGYWVLMRFVPVPGLGVPTHDIPLLDPNRNLAAWLDRKLLFGHLYEGTRDPEGLLSTVPALGTTLIGVLTGEWLRSDASAKRKAAWMVAMGVAGLAAGKFFNLWFPINKKLWTSSYVLFTAGFALVCLALCYWLLDVKQKRGRWTLPAIVFGANAIAAYTFSEMLASTLYALHVHVAGGGVISWQELVYQRLFSPLANPANASLLYSVVYVLVCWLVAWLLYRRRIFIKI